MNQKLANAIKARIEGLPFLDLVAGLVQVVEYEDPISNEDKMTTKRMPVSVDTNNSDCTATPEYALVPDGSKKSILYFEDGGLQQISQDSRGVFFRSSITMVCWYNRERLTGNTYSDVSLQMINEILERITGNPFNGNNLTRIKPRVASILPMDKGVFAKYTYDESTSQYLRPPYGFFGIVLNTTFSTLPECAPPLDPPQELPCDS